MLKPKDIDVVIYHDPCPDGSGAAMVAKYYYQQYPSNKIIEYYPMKVGTNLTKEFKNKNILLADLPLSLQDTNSLRENNKILIIDHHKTNKDNVTHLSETEFIFDMNMSGAMLVWEWYFPHQEAPTFIKYIQDRDLWRNSLENIELFGAWIRSLQPNPETYLKFLDNDLFIRTVTTTGSCLLEYNQYLIETALRQSKSEIIKINGIDYSVAHVNSTVLQSEIGCALLSHYPTIDFAYVYYHDDSDDTFNYSLRSENIRQDVSEIAKFYGGGGHRNAAGIKSKHLSKLGY